MRFILSHKLFVITVVLGSLIFNIKAINAQATDSNTQKEIANEYIISKVGRDYFYNNFTYTSYFSRPDNVYNIFYEYKPLIKYGVSEVGLSVSETEVVGFGLSTFDWVPVCLEDPSLCKYNLDMSDIERLSSRYNFKIKNLVFRPPHLTTTICPDTRLLMIDYRSGEVGYSEKGRIKCDAKIIITNEDLIRSHADPFPSSPQTINSVIRNPLNKILVLSVIFIIFLILSIYVVLRKHRRR